MKNSLILIALLFANPVWADCEKTKSDYDVVYCSTKIYIEADKEFNDAYKKLSAKLDMEGRKLLKEAQLAWIKARNQNCSENRGSEILLDMDCAANTTIERTQFLNDRHRECVSAGCMNSKLR